MSSAQNEAILTDRTLHRQAAARADRHLVPLHRFADSDDSQSQPLPTLDQVDASVSNNLVSNIPADITISYEKDD